MIIGDDGYIYVLDYYNGVIRKLSQTEVSTVSIKPDNNNAQGGSS